MPLHEFNPTDWDRLYELFRQPIEIRDQEAIATLAIPLLESYLRTIPASYSSSPDECRTIIHKVLQKTLAKPPENFSDSAHLRGFFRRVLHNNLLNNIRDNCRRWSREAFSLNETVNDEGTNAIAKSWTLHDKRPRPVIPDRGTQLDDLFFERVKPLLPEEQYQTLCAYWEIVQSTDAHEHNFEHGPSLYKELAHRLDISESALKSRINRMRTTLKKEGLHDSMIRWVLDNETDQDLRILGSSFSR